MYSTSPTFSQPFHKHIYVNYSINTGTYRDATQSSTESRKSSNFAQFNTEILTKKIGISAKVGKVASLHIYNRESPFKFTFIVRHHTPRYTHTHVNNTLILHQSGLINIHTHAQKQSTSFDTLSLIEYSVCCFILNIYIG